MAWDDQGHGAVRLRRHLWCCCFRGLTWAMTDRIRRHQAFGGWVRLWRSSWNGSLGDSVCMEKEDASRRREGLGLLVVVSPSALHVR